MYFSHWTNVPVQAKPTAFKAFVAWVRQQDFAQSKPFWCETFTKPLPEYDLTSHPGSESFEASLLPLLSLVPNPLRPTATSSQRYPT